MAASELHVEFTRLSSHQAKLSTKEKEVWCYQVPLPEWDCWYSWPTLIEEQGLNVSVGTVARINTDDEQAICLIA